MIGQIAAEASLDAPEEYSRETYDEYVERRKCLIDGLKDVYKRQGPRVGLIAKNGTGKTTFLNVIAGKEGYDNGNIVFRRDLRVDYLEQDPQYP